MIFPSNNIYYQRIILIFDPIKSIPLLNFIYIYVHQDIHFVDNDNYIIHILHEYEFYNTLLLSYDFDHGNNSGIITYFKISSQTAPRIDIIFFVLIWYCHNCIKLINYMHFYDDFNWMLF